MTQGQTHPALWAPYGLGVIVGVLAYGIAYLGVWPTWCYLPHQGVWTWAPPAGEVSMRYAGLLLYALGGVGVGWGLGHTPGIARRVAREKGRTLLAHLVFWSVLASLLLVLVVELHHVW